MFASVRKHLSLLPSFLKASAIADLEYRMNLALKVFTDIIWYSAQLAIFEVLFRHTTSISGWTLETTRVFMCVLFITDSLWMLLFSENLDRLSDKVRRGDLDLLLVKPVNSQFMLSFQRMSSAYIVNFVMTISVFVWALMRLPNPPEWPRLFLLLILVPGGLAITYGMKIFFAATAIIFTRAENINYIWYQLYRLGTRPDSIYPPWLRYVVLTILPVGFIASVPARLLLGSSEWLLLLAEVLVSIAVVYLSTRYWRFTLRHYSSASS